MNVRVEKAALPSLRKLVAPADSMSRPRRLIGVSPGGKTCQKRGTRSCARSAGLRTSSSTIACVSVSFQDPAAPKLRRGCPDLSKKPASCRRLGLCTWSPLLRSQVGASPPRASWTWGRFDRSLRHLEGSPEEDETNWANVRKLQQFPAVAHLVLPQSAIIQAQWREISVADPG